MRLEYPGGVMTLSIRMVDGYEKRKIVLVDDSKDFGMSIFTKEGTWEKCDAIFCLSDKHLIDLPEMGPIDSNAI